jgi:hypothetical protein
MLDPRRVVAQVACPIERVAGKRNGFAHGVLLCSDFEGMIRRAILGVPRNLFLTSSNQPDIYA